MELSAGQPGLSFAPYAEISCSQQNTQSSGKTFQDHGARQSIKGAIVAPAFAFVQERETQAPARQNGAGGRYGRCPHQVEPAVRLDRLSLITKRGDFFAWSMNGPGRDARSSYDQRHCVRRRFWAVKIPPIDEGRTRALQNNKQKQREPFHGFDANRSVIGCQCAYFFRQNAIARSRFCGKIYPPSGAMD
jgi:hypothetical protein